MACQPSERWGKTPNWKPFLLLYLLTTPSAALFLVVFFFCILLFSFLTNYSQTLGWSEHPVSQSALHFYSPEMQTRVKKSFSEGQIGISTEGREQSRTYPATSALENVFGGFLLRLSYVNGMRWCWLLGVPQLIALIARCPLADSINCLVFPSW